MADEKRVLPSSLSEVGTWLQQALDREQERAALGEAQQTILQRAVAQVAAIDAEHSGKVQQLERQIEELQQQLADVTRERDELLAMRNGDVPRARRFSGHELLRSESSGALVQPGMFELGAPLATGLAAPAAAPFDAASVASDSPDHKPTPPPPLDIGLRDVEHAFSASELGLVLDPATGLHRCNEWRRRLEEWSAAADCDAAHAARLCLAVLLQNGKAGMARDTARANDLVHGSLPWCRNAAEAGVATAQWLIGKCCMHGLGMEPALGQALAWYRLAAEQGHADAQNSMGVRYAGGEGVQKDYAEAVAWYRRAAEQDLAAAQYNLGMHYLYGKGVDMDKAHAALLFRRAAEQGHAKAQFCLGACYEHGDGVEVDTGLAVTWYRKAAAQGLASAREALRMMVKA